MLLRYSRAQHQLLPLKSKHLPYGKKHPVPSVQGAFFISTFISGSAKPQLGKLCYDNANCSLAIPQLIIKYVNDSFLEKHNWQTNNNRQLHLNRQKHHD